MPAASSSAVNGADHRPAGIVTRVAAMGGQRYWKDGRDVYDVILAILDYPQTENHPSFTLAA